MRPKRGKIIVEIVERKRKGKIVTPETANIGLLIEANVVSKGRGINLVDVGDAVLIDKYDGTILSDKERIIDQKDVYAILTCPN